MAELQTEGKKVDMNYAVVDLKRLQVQGLMAHLNSKTPSNGLILSERFAQQSHLKVGQTVPVGEFSNETQIVESKGTFKVIAIEKQLLNNADAYVDWNNQKLLDVIFYTLYVDSNI